MPSSIVGSGHAHSIGAVEAGVAVVVVAGGLGGLLLARALVDRRPTRSCLRTVLSLVVATVAARALLPLVDFLAPLGSLGPLLDAAMIALTVTTLWLARARQRELGIERRHSSR